jgi:L-asparaginase II
MRVEVAAAAELDPTSVATGVDGCGVVTFALPLERMANAFARLESLDAGPRVAAAMRAQPDLIRGPGSPDTELMRTLPDWVAKGGAEGVLCAASPEGLGVALKAEDGNWRALGPAAAAFLGRLGLETGDLGVASLENSRGETVAYLRVAS